MIGHVVRRQKSCLSHLHMHVGGWGDSRYELSQLSADSAIEGGWLKSCGSVHSHCTHHLICWTVAYYYSLNNTGPDTHGIGTLTLSVGTWHLGLPGFFMMLSRIARPLLLA